MTGVSRIQRKLQSWGGTFLPALPGDDDPPFVVWRDDQSMLLEDDQAAHEVLRQLCDEGDPLGVRAADFLRRHSPKEYAKVFVC